MSLSSHFSGLGAFLGEEVSAGGIRGSVWDWWDHELGKQMKLWLKLETIDVKSLKLLQV